MNIATEESAMSTVWREERLDVAWVNKHPDIEDERRGWGGLGRLNPAIGNQGMYRARKRRAYIAIEGRIRKKR